MSRPRAMLGLCVGVLAMSWGAPLARLTVAAPLAVAMWRMVLATTVIAPYAWLRGGIMPPRASRASASLAGLFLGLHFGLWIPSLWLTSVSASVVLVETAPLWVLAASPRFLGVPIGRRNVVSFVVAIAGVVLITGADMAVSSRALLGDALALGGALSGAAYLVVGKRLRGIVPLERYLATVYGGAAVVLVAAVVGLRVRPWPADGRSWLFLLALALVPTLIGHTLINWALAHLEAYQVNLTMLFEPVLATGWAWLVLAQAPPLYVVPGAGLILVALGLELAPARGARATGVGGTSLPVG